MPHAVQPLAFIDATPDLVHACAMAQTIPELAHVGVAIGPQQLALAPADAILLLACVLCIRLFDWKRGEEGSECDGLAW